MGNGVYNMEQRFFRIKHWKDTGEMREDPKLLVYPQIRHLSPNTAENSRYAHFSFGRGSGWDKVYIRLNSKKGLVKIYTPTMGFNPNGSGTGAWNGEYPVGMRTATTGGNVCIGEVVGGGWVSLDAFPFKGPVPATGNYFSLPQYFHKFTTIANSGAIQKPGSVLGGVDVYYPLISTNSDGKLYVKESLVEWFPLLPLTVKVRWFSGANLRVLPGVTNPKVGVVGYGNTVEILEYAPIGSEVWGRTADGWMALYYPLYARYLMQAYSTSWWMLTTAPPI